MWSPGPGFIPQDYTSSFFLPRHYTPGLYGVFRSGRKLSLISLGLSNGLINGGVYIRGGFLPEWKKKQHFGPFWNKLQLHMLIKIGFLSSNYTLKQPTNSIQWKNVSFGLQIDGPKLAAGEWEGRGGAYKRQFTALVFPNNSKYSHTSRKLSKRGVGGGFWLGEVTPFPGISS